jgi:hypothetical protein
MKDFHGFKKTATDQKSTTFTHPNGSKLVVAHGKLDPKTLKLMTKMPIHAGDVKKYSGKSNDPQDQVVSNDPVPTPNYAATPVQDISLPKDWTPEQEAKHNLDQTREGLKTVGKYLFQPPDQWSSDNSQQSFAPPSAMAQSPQGPAPTNVNLGSQPQTQPQNPYPQVANGNSTYDPYQGLNTQMAGNNAEAKAIGDLEGQKQKIYADQGQQLQDLNYQAQQNAWNNQQETQNAIDDMKNGHIDPKAYINNMSAPQKISTAIGLVLGGMGGGLMHTGGNAALDFLNKSIERDVNAQIENRNNKATVFHAMQQQYGNQQDALKMTHAFYLAKMQNDINEAAAKQGSPLALARAQQLNGPIQSQLQQLHFEVGMRQAAMNGNNGQADPAQMVRYLVPKEHQQKVFDEIDTAQNTAANAPQILQAFDKASNNMHAMDLVPGTLNADQKALHALMGPTFKDVEGTVRQAAMDNMFKNITPQVGDDANTKRTKRAALVGYLKSKSAAPVAKGYGLDLQKFNSTNFNGGTGFQKR